MTPEKQVNKLVEKEKRLEELNERIVRFSNSIEASKRILHCHGVEFIGGSPTRPPDGSDSPEDFEFLKQLLGVKEENIIYAPIKSGGYLAGTDIENVVLLVLLSRQPIFSRGTVPFSPFSESKPVKVGESFNNRAYLLRRIHIPFKKAPKGSVSGITFSGGEQRFMPDWDKMENILS